MTEQYRRAGENPVSNKLIRLMVAAAIVFLVDQAQAQSSAKVRKIGFLASPGTGPIPHFYEAFGKVCANSDTSKGKTSRLSSEPQKAQPG